MGEPVRRDQIVRRWKVLEPPEGLRRGLGSPALFGIAQGFTAASIYFAIGLIVERAHGLSWLVMLAAAGFFLLLVPSYVEGTSLHKERGGATVLARYGFNELWSFVAGWAILLDYLILIALCAFATTDYAALFWDRFAQGVPEFLLSAAVIVYVAIVHLRGAGPRRYDRAAFVVLADLALQLLIVALGLALLFDPEVLTDPAQFGGAPRASDLLFAFTLAIIAFAGLDASSGLAGQVAVSRRGLKRLIAVRVPAAIVPYVGIGLVASTVLPASAGQEQTVEAPMLALVESFDQAWLREPAALPRRRLGDRGARRGRQRRHAGPVAARLLAGGQPADPVARRAAAPALRDAGRRHRHRHAAGARARRAGRSRVPRRHLRVRRHARVHARAPVGDPPALARARSGPALQDAVQRPRRPRRAAAHRGRGRADLGDRVRLRAHATTAARGSSASPGWGRA